MLRKNPVTWTLILSDAQQMQQMPHENLFFRRQLEKSDCYRLWTVTKTASFLTECIRDN